MKKISKSNRGLTFITEALKIGQKFTYLIDKNSNEVRIIPGVGKNTVSKKKCGNNVKPLVDLRSSDIRQLVSAADYLEISVLANGNVAVKAHKKVRVNSGNVVTIKEILESRVTEFEIPSQMLKVVNGGYIAKTLFGKPTLADDYYFDYLMCNTQKNRIQPTKKEFRKVYDVISLFSGAGMLDKAFMDGNFRFVYGVDFEQAAVNTYRENIGDHIECRDIHTVMPEELPAADLVIGGPCCQAYSGENRHNINSEEAEQKRLLIDDYARIVRGKKPKVWIIENVPDLLTKEQGFYLNRLLNSLSDYEVTATVVADNEVGGYSVRRRAIVIGSKIGKIELPKVENPSSHTVKEALEKVDASWFNYNDVTNPRPETAKKMSFVPQGGNWQDIPVEFNTYGPNTHSCVMKRLKENEPSITLCNFRKSNILNPWHNRILTVAEAAAISGLGRDFRFIGTLSEMQQMVANGVTQAIGDFVKDAVLKALTAANKVIAFPVAN